MASLALSMNHQSWAWTRTQTLQSSELHVLLGNAGTDAHHSSPRASLAAVIYILVIQEFFFFQFSLICHQSLDPTILVKYFPKDVFSISCPKTTIKFKDKLKAKTSLHIDIFIIIYQQALTLSPQCFPHLYKTLKSVKPDVLSWVSGLQVGHFQLHICQLLLICGQFKVACCGKCPVLPQMGGSRFRPSREGQKERERDRGLD